MYLETDYLPGSARVSKMSLYEDAIDMCVYSNIGVEIRRVVCILFSV
jgi:hypothetical protein